MIAYLYVLDTLADWEIGYLTAELNSGRFLDKTKKKEPLIKVGATPKPIKTMGGFTVTPDLQIDELQLKDDDLLILPGADTWAEPANQKVISLLPENLKKKTTIAAICGATIALAENGLLNNRKHTSNDLGWLKLTCPNYLGEKFYVNQPAVSDDNLITASGLAALEFSYEVFKKTGVMKAQTAEAWYQLYRTRDAGCFEKLMESLK
jgi:putative intracellular protease/amidase